MSIRALSSELRQAFKAYVEQTHGERARARRGENGRPSRTWGFERVEISERARELAAAQQQARLLSDEQIVKSEAQQGDDQSTDGEETASPELDTETDLVQRT